MFARIAPLAVMVCTACASSEPLGAHSAGVVGDDRESPTTPTSWSAPAPGAFSDELHELGKKLTGNWYTATNWFDMTAIDRWREACERLGLVYRDAPVDYVLSSGYAEPGMINGSWAIRPADQGDGWFLRWVHGYPLGYQPAVDAPWDDVRIGEREVALHWFGPYERTPGTPNGALRDRSLVVAPGNGRIITVRFPGSVRILPYAFEGEPVGDIKSWPYRDRHEFAARLRALGHALAEGESLRANEAFSEAMTQLGWRWLSSGEALAERLELGLGFSIRSNEVSREGWIVHGPSNPESRQSFFLMPAEEPRFVCLTTQGWTEAPSTKQLPGSVLLISPGNGRLLGIEMDPHGRVLVLPQEFR